MASKQQHLDTDATDVASTSWLTKLYRSAPMEHVMLFVQASSAHALLYELAALPDGGILQFDDLNGDITAFQRRFAPQIKRCDEMERILSFFDSQFREFQVKLPDGRQTAKNFWARCHAELQEHDGHSANRIKKLEEMLQKEEQALRQLNDTHEKLLHEYNSAKELKFVLQQALHVERNMGAESKTSGRGQAGQFLKQLMGVINAGEDQHNFHRMVFRFTRGQAYITFMDIVDEANAPVLFDEVSASGLHVNQVQKVVFVAAFSGKTIGEKIHQVCSAFGAHVHSAADAETSGDIKHEVDDLAEKLASIGAIKKTNRNMAKSMCEKLSQSYWQWLMTVRLEKAVYHSLNKCDVSKAGYLVAQGWLMKEHQGKMLKIVQEAEGEGNNMVIKKVKKSPPTFFKTNKFTGVFQGMTDTYGVPRYQEANPSLFSCVTFPFLFGVMFGDIGHGTLLFAMAFALCYFERKLEKMDIGEVGGMLFGGRYMLLLMGFFAVYCGFIYNECFCLGLNLFGSIYHEEGDKKNGTAIYVYNDPALNDENVTVNDGHVYPFGIDPTWHVAENELTFINSFKMKTSVILGVAQMTMGILVKFTNAIYFQDRLELFFECIPQLLFMGCLFVYMDILIFVKWTTDWSQGHPDGTPNLINTMINMPLQMGGLGDEPPCYSESLQTTVQPILLVIAVLSIPMMLIPKPIMEYYKHKGGAAEHPQAGGAASRGDGASKDDSNTSLMSSAGAESTGAGHDDGHHDDHEEHSLGDLFIHQAIETIEFVLGCVSNTASYLRLWALSLAHAELAKTFWDLLMANTINMGGGANFIIVFGGYSAWAAVTLFVLMCMDSLECFLHALRLHWVEFQNKFYRADGYAFVPFEFKPIKCTSSNPGN